MTMSKITFNAHSNCNKIMYTYKHEECCDPAGRSYFYDRKRLLPICDEMNVALNCVEHIYIYIYFDGISNDQWNSNHKQMISSNREFVLESHIVKAMRHKQNSTCVFLYITQEYLSPLDK